MGRPMCGNQLKASIHIRRVLVCGKKTQISLERKIKMLDADNETVKARSGALHSISYKLRCFLCFLK